MYYYYKFLTTINKPNLYKLLRIIIYNKYPYNNQKIYNYHYAKLKKLKNINDKKYG